MKPSKAVILSWNLAGLTRRALSFVRVASAAYGLISKPTTSQPWTRPCTSVVPTPAKGSRTQGLLAERRAGRYFTRQSSTNSAEKPATQGTQRWRGNSRFRLKAGSRKPAESLPVSIRVCCIGGNLNRDLERDASSAVLGCCTPSHDPRSATLRPHVVQVAPQWRQIGAI